MGKGLIIVEASRSHPDTPHSLGFLWTSDQPKEDTPTDNIQHSQETDIYTPRRDSNPQFLQARGRRPTT